MCALSSSGDADGCAGYRPYPAPEWLAEACNAHVVADWLKATHEPFWRQPIGLDFGFRFPHPLDREPEREPEAFVCADRHLGARQFIAEMACYAAVIGERPRVSDIHWSSGAGALDDASLRQIRDAIDDHFEVVQRARFAVRIDASSDALRRLPRLYELGVTDLHISSSTADDIRSWVRAARKIGFPSIAVDVPFDGTVRTQASIDEAILRGATRVVIARARAVLPAHARASRDESRAWRRAASALTDARYQRVAADVYALPGDAYAAASRRGGLSRQPFGYTTHASGVLLAFGPARVGYVGALQYQNHRRREAYLDHLDRGVLPIERGLVLTRDDLLRRAIIAGLSIQLAVDVPVMEAAYSVDFRRDLADELARLHPFERAGLVTIDEQEIRITAAGQFDCMRICEVFDRYARLMGRAAMGGR